MRHLHIKHTAVDSLTVIREMVKLTDLNICGTHVSDVAPLTSLSNLQTLDIRLAEEIITCRCLRRCGRCLCSKRT